MGDDPSVIAKLTPQLDAYHPMPTETATANEPGVLPFALSFKEFGSKLDSLPTRGPGTLMTNNALLRAVGEDPTTRRCMYRVACSVCRDQAHERVRAALLNVRSLTIDKLDDDGCKCGDRPLGMGECESRLMCGAAMQQERAWIHNHFTTMLP